MKNSFSRSVQKNLRGDKNTRVLVLFAFFIFSFLIYAHRLFSMQILEGSEYREQSIVVAKRSNTIPAQRGEILDRNSILPLVVNTDTFSVELTPAEIPQGFYDTVASRLAQYLGISKVDIDNRIPENMRKSYTAISILSQVPFSVVSNIAENKYHLPGVSWRLVPVRNYIASNSLSHILGYVGNISQEEINVLYNKGYNRNSIVGKMGIEKQYDLLLQGKPGSISNVVDARGKIVENEKPILTPPEQGKNLVLTIDSRIQTLAEDALGDRVGAVVVLRPSNGEILALVSYPFFDSNIFTQNISTIGEKYNELVNAKDKPLLNRAVAASYPPGSTFKVVMMTALLEEASFSPFQRIECKGFLDYGNRTFNCHVHKPGHGYLDLKNALAQSCDVYFWTIGRDSLGIDKIGKYAKDFGFGKLSKLDFPTEVAGFIPDPIWKERSTHEKWLGGDTMNASIGQGYIKATPLQVANMLAMVCNNGVIYKPHLLKEIRDPSTNDVIETIEREVIFKSSVNENVWKSVQEACRYTVTHGTPQYPMHNRLYGAAGKTGTSEVANFKDNWHSWMVAYAPYDAPVEEQVVVATLVEATEDSFWEWWAPYATNIIIQGIFANQTYEEALKVLGFEYLKQNNLRRE